jgi:hypothetical protein
LLPVNKELKKKQEAQKLVNQHERKGNLPTS